MPVILGELSILCSPLSQVRVWALVTGCLTLTLGSLVAEPPAFRAFKTLCVAAWGLHFALTLLVVLVEFVQLQGLVPGSWRNLPVTLAAQGALVHLGTSAVFPWLLAGEEVSPEAAAAAVFSCLTCLAYASETLLILLQSRERRGYMASAPGLLKVFQVFGGGVMLLLVAHQDRPDGSWEGWQFWLSAAIYVSCFLMSLGTVLVMIADCANRCPLPFDRLMVAFSHLSVLSYGAAAALSFVNVLQLEGGERTIETMIGSIVTFLTLIAYTLDLAFSIKLLCDRFL